MNFMLQADRRGLKIDSIGVHSYSAPDAGQVIERLEETYRLYERPIWVTEIAVADWRAVIQTTTPNGSNGSCIGKDIGLVGRQHAAFHLVGQPAEIVVIFRQVANLAGHFRMKLAVVAGLDPDRPGWRPGVVTLSASPYSRIATIALPTACAWHPAF
ncbi:glycosyl hydrolase [Paracoccus mutanolyticus]|nr:glycosyl hydrolase [Paracoccus mutanolyticus]